MKRLPAQPDFKNINTTIGKIQRPGPGNDYPSWALSLRQVSACYAGMELLLLGEAVANSLTLQGTFRLGLRNKKRLSSRFLGSALLKQKWNPVSGWAAAGGCWETS